MILSTEHMLAAIESPTLRGLIAQRLDVALFWWFCFCRFRQALKIAQPDKPVLRWSSRLIIIQVKFHGSFKTKWVIR